MADLHRKLALRRKGISGIKEFEAKRPTELPPTSNVSLIDSISSMIPAPINVNNSVGSDNESDWE